MTQIQEAIQQRSGEKEATFLKLVIDNGVEKIKQKLVSGFFKGELEMAQKSPGGLL